MITLTPVGVDELAAAIGNLTDTREIVAVANPSGQLVADAAAALAPSRSGTLRGSVGVTVTPSTTGTVTHVGTDSPYARPMHVPYLSDGAVKYASVTNRNGRTFGRLMVNNPFLVSAIRRTETTTVDQYVTATGKLVDRALAGVPRG